MFLFVNQVLNQAKLTTGMKKHSRREMGRNFEKSNPSLFGRAGMQQEVQV